MFLKYFYFMHLIRNHNSFFLKSNSTSDGNKKYQSLHRELDPPPPTYESYRLPQKSGTESGGQANEASSSDDINEK